MYFAGKNTISIICNLCLICRGVRSGTVQDVGHSLALQPKSFPPKQALRTFNIQNNTQKSEKTPKKKQIFPPESFLPKKLCEEGGLRWRWEEKPLQRNPREDTGCLVELTQQTTAITWGNTSSRTRPDLKHPRKTARTTSENSRKTQKERQTLLPLIKSRQAMRTTVRRHLRVPVIDALLLPDAA